MRVFTATLAFILLCSTLLKAKSNFSSQKLHFLENKGQVKDQYHNQRTDIDFKISSGSLNVFIGNGELHYQFHKPSPAGMDKGITHNNEPIPMYRMDVILLNANKNARITAEGKLPYYEQHYRSSAPVTAHSFSKITYKDIYPSIDWVLYIEDNQLEYDFVIHKGGNPNDIKLQYNGATALAVNKDGSLTATTPMGSITEAAPYSYQEDGKQIASSFVLNNNTLSFKAAAYIGKLVIDPKLVWSTYYGGQMGASGLSVAVDDSGYVYMAGNTASDMNIATIGSHQVNYSGWPGDAFLVKFDSSGQRKWATYYGGSEYEHNIVVTCDKFNGVYLAGTTRSTTNISSSGSHQENLSYINDDAFLAKFNNLGERIWATYYGGDSVEHGMAVSCDDSGNVYLTGTTSSLTNISTPGAHQSTYAGIGVFSSSDAFLAKFDSTGIRQWGTYYGGSEVDMGYSVVTDANCNVYISGHTFSNDALSSTGAHQELQGGNLDAYIAKFNNNGQRVWGTYYGGTEGEYEGSMGLYDNSLYFFAYTESTNNIATPGSFQSVFGGLTDMYLVKFDTAGTREWSTYYGNAGSEEMQTPTGNRVSCDNSGNIYLTFVEHSGVTGLSTGDGPQDNFGGGQFDVVLAKFNSSGAREWASYFGSCGLDVSGGCAADNYGNIFIAGYTGSDHMATPGSHQFTKNGSSDAFIAKFNNDQFGITGDTSICAGTTVTYYASHVPGAESYTWTLPNGWTGNSTVDTINVTADTTSGIISVVANKSCSTEPPQELYVTVHPLPTPFISAMSGIISVTPSYVGYQWYEGTNPIAGATDSTYIITSYGSYTVIVTDSNGCIGQSNAIHLSVNTINPNDNNIKLYPNPNSGSFTLSLTSLSSNEEVLIEITDITGRRIHTFTEAINNNSLQMNISLDRSLPSGQYFLKVSSGELNNVLMFTKY